MRLFQKYILSICVIYTIFYYRTLISQNFIPDAFCSVPVADLLSSPLCNFFTTQDSEEAYQLLPYAEKQSITCPRIGQLLFNEPVKIIKTCDQEVEVLLEHMHYVLPGTGGKKRFSYWMLKKNLTPITPLCEHALPPPFLKHNTTLNTPQQANTHAHDNFSPHTQAHKQELKNTETPSVICLHMPYYDPITNQTFSAGTRFVCAHPQEFDSINVHTQELTHHNLPVLVYDRQLEKTRVITIPDCYWIKEKRRTKQQQRIVCIKILKNWAHLTRDIHFETSENFPEYSNTSYVPYVIGGASISTFITKNTFSLTPSTHTHQKSRYYTRHTNTCSPEYPLTGSDCTHLVLRAAQLAGIPFTAGNSLAQLQELKKFSDLDNPEPGDLIYWKGHVAIISDTTKNLLIEARSYQDGYGVILEIPYNQELKDIFTTNDLVRAYHDKKEITRLHKSGKKCQTIHKIMLLKLLS